MSVTPMPESKWRAQRRRWAVLWSRLAWRIAERCANALFCHEHTGDDDDLEYARKMARWHREARNREDEAYFEADSELAELPEHVQAEEGFR